MAKEVTLVSPDGKREIVATTAVHETDLKWRGFTVKGSEDGSAEPQSLAAKRGRKPKAPVVPDGQNQPTTPTTP